MTRTIEQIDYPKTAAEWWLLFDEHQQEMRDFVADFHPVYRQSMRTEMAVTAPGAEEACKKVRDDIVGETQEDPLTAFDLAVKEEDGIELVRLLNQAWFGLPESVEVRALPGFGVLCDLCSEGEVLQST